MISIWCLGWRKNITGSLRSSASLWGKNKQDHPAPSCFRRPAGRPGSPNCRAPSPIVSIVRIEPPPADRSQGARRRPPGVRNRPGRRGGEAPAVDEPHRAAPQRASGARYVRSLWSRIASGVAVQDSHDQPPRVRIGMVFPIRQEFTIAVGRRPSPRVIGPVAIDENSLCQSYHLHRQPSAHAPKAV